MKNFREMLVLMVLGVSLLSMLTCVLLNEIEIYKNKKANQRNKSLLEKQQQIEVKLLMKRRAFEDYKAYIESLEDEVVKDNVSYMKDYVASNVDIRETLGEFTVQDVVNMFY